jgi:hypothetical protein
VSDHYIYLYTNKYKYQDGDLLLSGLSGRVEEVIDDNWYVIKLCSDIDMCP